MSPAGETVRGQVSEKVLVVDDEQLILGLLEKVLGREGYQVTTTPHSEEVVWLALTEGFDLAIVDVGLRRLSSSKRMMKMIREISPGTAIVVMTSYPGEEVRGFAHEHAQGYLEKPFPLEQLLTVVRSAVEERLMYAGTARAGASSRARPVPVPLTTQS